MHPPVVSFIMPNYNCAQYLPEAIESMLNQSFTDFECIIIDDGSTDASWEIIQRYAQRDPRIKALRNLENRHIVYSRNRGLEQARGRYIAFLDSDDITYPDRLQKQVDFMALPENSQVGMCGANIDIIDASSKKTGEREFPETHELCRAAIWFRNPFAVCCVLMRKECLDSVGLFDANYPNAEDLDLWIRVGSKYKLYNIQERLSAYRIATHNSIMRQQKRMIHSTLKLRRRALQLGYKMPFKGAVYYVCTYFIQFFPPKFVLWVFSTYIVGQGKK